MHTRTLIAATLAAWLASSGYCLAATTPPADLEAEVDALIQPLMQTHDVPGMAVALLANGEAHEFHYGVASRDERRPVGADTLFEIGSVSKTFTATLAAYAVAQGKLSLTASASDYLPALRGSAFDQISMLQLGTYTAGGLPLQFPPQADSPASMIDYYRHWQPSHAPGTQRLYSNPSIGLFGYLAAKSLGQPFAELMENRLFKQLGLRDTFIHVPPAQMHRYAQGYNRDNQPARLSPGALDGEAYGVKTTAGDLLNYLRLNIQPGELDAPLRQAIALTHSRYYQAGALQQGLGWELYPYPVELERLLEGNSAPMALQAHAAQWFDPPRSTQAAQLVNKTGSTNGFGAYVAYVPDRQLGIVLLANRNYPNPARIEAAYHLLKLLDSVP